jgi:1-acyl-sn-glycerol-3-phosphate acyltransferase
MSLLYRLCWLLIRGFMVVFCRLKILGAENVPRVGGMILASNHVSAVDPPFLGSSLNRPLYYMAKKELFSVFLLGPLIRKVNAFPVDRAIFDKSALQRSLEILKNGGGLIMFPEGTRSKNGELGKAKPGIGMLARSALAPIIPAHIHNSRRSYLAFLTGRRLIISFGEPIDPGWIGGLPDDKNGFREIAGKVLESIAGLKSRVLNL